MHEPPTVYNWPAPGADRGLSAHEEHTIMVALGGPVVLTAASG